MQSEVIVRFDAGCEFTLPLAAAGAMSPQDARRWLDEQFVANECEPIRATSKVLTADKVLALAATVGPARFSGEPAWAAAYARAAVGALARPVVRVDVDTRTVTF